MSRNSQGKGLDWLVGVWWVAGLGLISVLTHVAFAEFTEEWRLRSATGQYVERPDGLGDVERCSTCHEDVERVSSVEEHVYLGAHLLADVGCSACHGGIGRALQSQAAHSQDETGSPNVLLAAPWTEASCARCHLPGSVEGTERLANGALLFLELGCALCHTPAERGAAVSGPSLRGRRWTGIPELEAHILDPRRFLSDGEMPAFAPTFQGHEAELQAVELYVYSLSLAPGLSFESERADPRDLEAPCSSCHANTPSQAAPTPAHRCSYILSKRELLRCDRCHADKAFQPGKPCPSINEHRSGCGACHTNAGWEGR